jgi:hypothetical protein
MVKFKMKIHNSTVLITGANRGIGLEMARMCALEKAHLHLVIRKNDPGLVEDLTKRGALSVTLWVADLSLRNEVATLIEKLSPHPIDIVINNAGLLTGGLLEDQPLEDIYAMFHVNLLSLVHLTHGLLPSMIKRGRGKIVNNSSVSAFMHFPCATTYAASKAAVVAFTNSLAAELKGTGVSTLCLITPGVKTRMFDEIEIKYAKNIEIPADYISAELYAQRVKNAILEDVPFLYPSGPSWVGLNIARYLPFLFKMEIGRRFHR